MKSKWSKFMEQVILDADPYSPGLITQQKRINKLIYEVQWKEWDNRWKTICFCKTKEKALLISEIIFDKNYDVRIKKDEKIISLFIVKERN